MLALTNNITNAEDFNEACRLAINALYHSIPYTSQNFSETAERDFIMNKIFEALENKQLDVREKAMQCLVEVGREEYLYIEHYFQKIAAVTAQAALHDESSVGA